MLQITHAHVYTSEKLHPGMWHSILTSLEAVSSSKRFYKGSIWVLFVFYEGSEDSIGCPGLCMDHGSARTAAA